MAAAMTTRPVRRIAIIASQFAAYHVDRCEAVARRLGTDVEVVPIELAAGSDEYRWEASGAVAGATKRTLFPGKLEDIGWWRRFTALRRTSADCDAAFMGISYDRPEAIALSWLWRMTGRQMVVMTESKADDFPRSAWREAAKRIVLSAYRGAVVGARRQADYMRALGFSDRPVTPGYDTVGTQRVRQMAGLAGQARLAPAPDAPFLFVGRYVPKKGLDTLLAAYGHYRARSATPRPLVLAGDGELRMALEEQAAALDIARHVTFTGFLSAPDVAARMAQACALVLPSREEQWGLVVNEALACGLPVICSEAVGSRDALVRDGANGFVVPVDEPEALARSMADLDAADWQGMSEISGERVHLADTERLADAVEVMLGLADDETRERHRQFSMEAGLGEAEATRALEALPDFTPASLAAEARAR